MSNQTKTTTNALVTQWELGTKTFIVTESQSLPIIISPLLFRCFEKNNQELLSPTPHNVVLNMQKNKQFKLFFNFNIFNKIILTCSFMQNKVKLHSDFNGQYSFSTTANKVSSIHFLSPHFPRNFSPAQSSDTNNMNHAEMILKISHQEKCILNEMYAHIRLLRVSDFFSDRKYFSATFPNSWEFADICDQFISLSGLARYKSSQCFEQNEGVLGRPWNHHTCHTQFFGYKYLLQNLLIP